MFLFCHCLLYIIGVLSNEFYLNIECIFDSRIFDYFLSFVALLIMVVSDKHREISFSLCAVADVRFILVK